MSDGIFRDDWLAARYLIEENKLEDPQLSEPEVLTTDQLIRVSIAISLKRIADALAGDSENTGIKLAVIEIANLMAAQTAMIDISKMMGH